jgi:parallel beta-helix repeat protein
MSGAGCGIYLYYSHGTISIGNTLYDNVDNGINSLLTDNCDILNNHIYGNDYAGIYVLYADSWTIQGNSIWNQVSENGIHLFECADFEIDGNYLFNNEYDGIAIYQSERCNITNNMVYNNVKGIHVATSENILIMGNIIYDNFYGVFLNEVNSTQIFYNDFVLNTHNALEMQSIGMNYWDDGVSMGNWYWGIPRDLASYEITNGTVNVNADSYPMCSMWIDDAPASSYEFASTGNLVTWTAYAHNPDFYEVYFGSIGLGSGTWTGSNITFNVDGLNAAVHNLVIIIYHISGHNLTASVEITVADTTPPTWVSTPVDQTINYGETLSYQLLAYDYDELGTWSVNNTLFSINSGLLTNASTLEPGDYRLRITVEDASGNELSVDIWVHVVESTTPTGTGGQPLDAALILVLGVGGAAAVIIIIIVVLKKKGT